MNSSQEHPRLRIGINALYLIPGSVGGTEIYLRNLLQAMAALDHESTFFVFTNRETDSGLVPPSSHFIEIRQPIRAANRPLRLAWEQTFLPLEARKLRLDCILNPGFTAPVITHCPNVTVFHDLQHKRHPEHFRWFDKPAWDLFLGLAVRRSRMLIADSEATRDDLIRYYNVNPSRVRVALLGVEDEFFSIAAVRGPVRPYLLCVSTIHPHKNTIRLVRVFDRFRRERPEFRLVLAGLRGFQAPEVERQIAELNLTDCVKMTGWIPRVEIYDLFRHAAAFVYPSTFEGFGLPVIEAMAAGVPLACSDIEPLRSITGDAAVKFDPHSDEDMLAALHRVVSNPDTVEPARVRARQFTWRHCAEETLAAIRSAVTGEDPPAESSYRSLSRGTSQ
ncbi:MAG: glycosyltransferase family 4 protein [Bryobacteraceae bacterium]|nr:glycosyltransferase family 4 protein [Bryobacteraceae bacterium]